MSDKPKLPFRAVESVASNEEWVRMRIYDGELKLDDAVGELLRLERAQHAATRRRKLELEVGLRAMLKEYSDWMKAAVKVIPIADLPLFPLPSVSDDDTSAADATSALLSDEVQVLRAEVERLRGVCAEYFELAQTNIKAVARLNAIAETRREETAR